MAQDTSTGQPVIVLIHGLGLKGGADQEFNMWRDALSPGLADMPAFAHVPMHMAYYSDALHPEVHMADEGAPPAVRGRGVDANHALASDVAAAEDQVVEALVARYRQYEADKQRDVGVVPDPALAPHAPTTRSRDLHMLEPVELAPGDPYPTFVRDVVKYFGLGHREPVNARLEAVLDAAGGGRTAPILLISHSLGTIVSYDVLAGGDYHVDTWITLGSPLGYTQDLQRLLKGWLDQLDVEQAVRVATVGARVETVMSQLGQAVNTAKQQLDRVLGFLPRPRGGAPAAATRGAYTLPAPTYPDGKVDRWYNVFDPSDPVASPPAFGDPTLADEYLSGGRERVYDIVVKNPASHPHSEVGYLSLMQTTWVVRDFLLRQGVPAPTG